MRTKVRGTVSLQQAGYKRNFEMKVRRLRVFVVCKMVCVSQPPLNTLDADRPASAKYDKLLQSTEGPLQVL